MSSLNAIENVELPMILKVMNKKLKRIIIFERVECRNQKCMKKQRDC